MLNVPLLVHSGVRLLKNTQLKSSCNHRSVEATALNKTMADGNVLRRIMPDEMGNSQGLLHWTVQFEREIMFCIYRFYNSLVIYGLKCVANRRISVYIGELSFVY